MNRAFILTTFFATQAIAMELPPFRTDVPDAVLDRRHVDVYHETKTTTFNGPVFQAKRNSVTIEVVNYKDGKFVADNATPWRELFNGKDLTGWKTIGSAIWKAEDGVLIGGQFGDPKRSGLIRTEDSFTDFELELEFQIDEHGKYNSGAYLRNDPNTANRTGYQVNIGRGAAGEFCGGIYTTDWLAKGDDTDTVRKPKEWNALRILAKGAHIQVELNGKKIVDLVDPKPDPKFLQKGVIGFQTYGAEGHDGWVKFRAIKIRELTK